MTSRRLLALAILASLAACSDDPAPGDICDEKGTFARIDAPEDGALLTEDASDTLPGFQATVTASTGVARIWIRLVAYIAQQNSGSRLQVIPGHRIL